MDNVQNLKDFSTGTLVEKLQAAVSKAVNVPEPNENTDLHLALVPVGDLKTIIALLGPRK
jgi:hypothetical protein